MWSLLPPGLLLSSARRGQALLIAAGMGVAGCQAPESPPSRRPESPPVRLEPFPGVVVLPGDEGGPGRVELAARVCLDEGWLEQIACGPRSREHESLLVPSGQPRQIHAALLAAGFMAGAPGGWRQQDGETRFTPPRGSRLAIDVRYRDETGIIVEQPVRGWIRDHRGRVAFPDEPWVFAGSRLERDPDGGELYLADLTGSIIGLVTFGDEVIGFSRVLADRADVQPPEWVADSDAMPPVGTEVTIVISGWGRDH